MRRRYRPQRPKPRPEQRSNANEHIRADIIFVVDEQDNPLGEMTPAEALTIAKSKGLDLVEVSPKAVPPVCRIIDFGKFQYKKAKQQRQQKAHQKKVMTKGVRIGLKTDTHDLLFKKAQIEKFLKNGHKVRIEIFLRGREKAHADLARNNIAAFRDQISYPFSVEEDFKRFPSGFHTTIVPK